MRNAENPIYQRLVIFKTRADAYREEGQPDAERMAMSEVQDMDRRELRAEFRRIRDSQ